MATLRDGVSTERPGVESNNYSTWSHGHINRSLDRFPGHLEHQCVLTAPHSHAGAWTEDEMYTIYREKLVRLRALYTSQLTRLKHLLARRRREYLLEWTAAGGSRERGKCGIPLSMLNCVC